MESNLQDFTKLTLLVLVSVQVSKNKKVHFVFKPKLFNFHQTFLVNSDPFSCNQINICLREPLVKSRQQELHMQGCRMCNQ